MCKDCSVPRLNVKSCQEFVDDLFNVSCF